MSIQLKRGLTSEINSNYVLKQGQIGIEMPQSRNSSSNPFKLKVGDGYTIWSNLPYMPSVDLSDYLTTNKSPAQAVTNRGQLDFSTSNSSPVVTLSTVGSGSYSTFEIYMRSKQGNTGFVTFTGGGTNSNYDVPDNKFGLVASNKVFVLGCSKAPIGNIITAGFSNTSDRSAKSGIKYISSIDAHIASVDNHPDSSISVEDILNFVKNIEPVTYYYNNDQVNSVEECIEKYPDDVNLGLIADDVVDHKIFPYIGNKYSHPDGSTNLGLKPAALAVAALTCCKYLMSRLDSIT